MSLLLFLFGKRKNKSGNLVIKKRTEGEAFFRKYVSVITDSYYDQYENFMLGLSKSFSIPEEELKKWNERLAENKKASDTLSKTAELNNAGIKLEKAGKIDEAIKVYEQNLTLRNTATHSYDRLMILYRKQKLYEEEVRVIDIAIKLFTQENEKRFDRALKGAKGDALKNELQKAWETQADFKDTDGKYLLSLYPVQKWKERRLKSLALLGKGLSD